MNHVVAGPGRRLFWALPLAALLALAAQAASLGWMKGETARYFTDRDWELVGQALQATLDGAPDGETREWSNEKSGAHGSMTPLSTETRDDVTCRRLRLESVAKGSSSSHSYLFCRRGDGPWGIGEPTG
jgi:surface antigen